MVALNPRIFKLSNDGLVFEETYYRSEIVAKPSKTAVVKINDSQAVSFQEEVYESQVGVDQSKSVQTLSKFNKLAFQFQAGFFPITAYHPLSV